MLGANDGIVSTASLIVGVAAADSSREAIFLAGVAGVVAGAMSMAAGEYVSVSSQADTERADLDLERRALREEPAYELEELTRIYVERGLDRELAAEVARQLMRHDALGAHARDELGISKTHSARPIQAALASAGAFAVGAAVPTALVLVLPRLHLGMLIAAAALPLLGILGALSARAGGATLLPAILRLTIWGAIAMAATAGIGRLVGVGL
ncbi:MAG: VIT family protein [Polyangiaceae bacterium]